MLFLRRTGCRSGPRVVSVVSVVSAPVESRTDGAITLSCCWPRTLAGIAPSTRQRSIAASALRNLIPSTIQSFSAPIIEVELEPRLKPGRMIRLSIILFVVAIQDLETQAEDRGRRVNRVDGEILGLVERGGTLPSRVIHLKDTRHYLRTPLVIPEVLKSHIPTKGRQGRDIARAILGGIEAKPYQVVNVPADALPVHPVELEYVSRVFPEANHRATLKTESEGASLGIAVIVSDVPQHHTELGVAPVGFVARVKREIGEGADRNGTTRQGHVGAGLRQRDLKG